MAITRGRTGAQRNRILATMQEQRRACGRVLTVADLAAAHGSSYDSVRVHLLRLEVDGLVRRVGPLGWEATGHEVTGLSGGIPDDAPFRDAVVGVWYDRAGREHLEYSA